MNAEHIIILALNNYDVQAEITGEAGHPVRRASGRSRLQISAGQLTAFSFHLKIPPASFIKKGG
jgi:hypothetical protein